MPEPIYCRWEPSGPTQAIFAFDESKIERDDSGQFSSGGGSSSPATVTWNRSDKPAAPYSQSAKLEYTRGDAAPNKYTMMEPRYTSGYRSRNLTDSIVQEREQKRRDNAFEYLNHAYENPTERAPGASSSRMEQAAAYIDHLNYYARGPEERKDNFELRKELEKYTSGKNSESSKRIGNIVRRMVGMKESGMMYQTTPASRAGNELWETEQGGPNEYFPEDHWEKGYTGAPVDRQDRRA